MKRRTLLQRSLAALAAGGAGCAPQRQNTVPESTPPLSLAGLSGQIASRQLTATALTARCLKRIAEIDKAGPMLNAVIERNPEAASIAADLDRQPWRGSLHGVPILIKDNIDTADAMETTAGSLGMIGHKPADDAFLVKQLRKAGAVLLGKTNLSEWANIRSPKSTSGWSGRGGLTRNPHVLDHNASGSSSGSAVAVAAGLAPGAIGTETDGSIISPASACGIVGLKPTVGLVSRSGIIPISHWQDTAGPMARSVRDVTMILNAIAGVDVEDSATATAQAHLTDFTRDLVPDSLQGKRLGVVRSLAGSHAGVLAIFDTALQKLREAGAVVIDPVELPNEARLGGLFERALLAELRTDLSRYLAARGGPLRSLADVVAFNNDHQAMEMPYFGQEYFDQAELMVSPEIIATAAAAREELRRLSGPEGIDAALQKHRLAALICPTNDPIHKTNLAAGDADIRCCCTPAAVAGYPHLTVPMGFVSNLPVGLSFFGAAWSDTLLLSLGYGFEQVMSAYRAPRFLAA